MPSTAQPLDPAALAARVKAAQLPPPRRRRQIRMDAQVSLRQMAAALGKDAMTILRWEKGRTRPSLEDAARYRDLLDALESAVGE